MQAQTPEVVVDGGADHAAEAWSSCYATLSARRTTYDTLMWQTPVISLTGQAFLFSIALAADSSTFAKLITSTLALATAVISVQLMAKHRTLEELDNRLLEAMELRGAPRFRIGPSDEIVLHSSGSERIGFLYRLKSRHPAQLRSGSTDPQSTPSGWFVRVSSYGIWRTGLCLYAAAAVMIIAHTFWTIAASRAH